eukprot:TRINITY_DN6276_c0_g1_i2.p1 TRINITY_DN6276_c0_g1~~TRINITY_DN6276_c0_g1_i2.p1  ORF type:complete len:778 (-),score=94.89 TRINITY_DN6276_c0_g1_i2:99-2336(-)
MAFNEFRSYGSMAPVRAFDNLPSDHSSDDDDGDQRHTASADRSVVHYTGNESSYQHGDDTHHEVHAASTQWSYNDQDAELEDDIEMPDEDDTIFERKQEGTGDLFNLSYAYVKDKDGIHQYRAVHRATGAGSKRLVVGKGKDEHIEFAPTLMASSIWDDMRAWVQTWDYSLVYLIILGVLSGLISASIDYSIDYLGSWRQQLFRSMPHPLLGALVWWAYLIIPVMIICHITFTYTPHASGSGVPEIKTILSGTPLEHYLHWTNGVVKVVGMSVVCGCGVMLGKPLSHVGAVLASELLRLVPLFSHLNKDPVMRQQMLASGAACGVSGNFGSPLGGVLFSIEVTSTYYPLRNYLYAFVSCIFASISYLVARQKMAFIETTFRMNDYTLTELIFFAIVGFFGGCFGVMYVKMNNFWVTTRRRFARVYPFVKNPYFGLLFLGTLTAFFTLPSIWGAFAGFGNYRTTKAMLTQSALPPEWYIYDNEVWWTLLYFFFSRWIGTAWSTTLVVPGGSFVPLICAGSVMGRFIGEVIKDIFPNGIYAGTAIVPGVYGAIGAAALLCGGAHSLSAAVIVFELTGQLNLITPLLIAVIVAYYVGTEFGVSIYDQGLINRGLPWLPPVRSSLRSYKKRVRDFMSDCYFLTAHANKDDVKEFLEEHFAQVIPIVDDADNRTLLGLTTRANLEAYIRGEAPKVVYDTPQVQLSSEMLLTAVHLLFIGMRLPMAPVTDSGRLIGVINRSDLIIVVADHD